MIIPELVSKLEELSQKAKRYDNMLSVKSKLSRNEANARDLVEGYVQVCQEIKARLENQLVSKAEILSSEIQNEKDKLHEKYKIKLIEFQNNVRTIKSILGKEKKIIEQQKNAALATVSELKEKLEQEKNASLAIVKEKSKGFPWIADAWSDYLHLVDLKESDYIKTKKNPAKSAAERMRDIAREKRTLGKQFRVTRNLIKYYESLFPWLPEFVGEDLDDLISQITNKSENEYSDEDPVSFYLTKGEYEHLSVIERNQRALDRYWSKKKRSWEIGRDYERYIGYLYEKDGYSVYYQGIEQGLEDLGRDLIAKKDYEVKIIQCKYWAQHRTIHEKHICQLFGTTVKYWIEQKMASLRSQPEFLLTLVKRGRIKPVFITSTGLSPVAKEFASELEIEVKEKFGFEKYPCVKCNVSKGTREKIYHLPMDQQYDRTVIEEERNESYVETVAEAENQGFRRAWRWRGEQSQEGA